MLRWRPRNGLPLHDLPKPSIRSSAAIGSPEQAGLPAREEELLAAARMSGTVLLIFGRRAGHPFREQRGPPRAEFNKGLRGDSPEDQLMATCRDQAS